MTSVYHRILKERLDELPPVLGQFLRREEGGVAVGRLRVTRSGGWLHHLAAKLLGIPPASDYELRLEVTPHGEGQRWVRRFGSHVLETVQTESGGLLVEKSGPGLLGFDLAVEGATLRFLPRRAWVLGIRIPLALSPRIDAENGPGENGGWQVRIQFRVPILGLVGTYEGEVKPLIERPAGL